MGRDGERSPGVLIELRLCASAPSQGSNIPGRACRSNAPARSNSEGLGPPGCQTGLKAARHERLALASGRPEGRYSSDPGSPAGPGTLTPETLMKKWSAPKAVVIRLGMEINSYVAHR